MPVRIPLIMHQGRKRKSLAVCKVLARYCGCQIAESVRFDRGRPAASVNFFHAEPILVWIAYLENGYEGQFSEPTRRGDYP
jgi:hypothetical protein